MFLCVGSYLEYPSKTSGFPTFAYWSPPDLIRCQLPSIFILDESSDDDLLTRRLSQVASTKSIAPTERLAARLLLGSVGPISRTAKASVNDIGRMPTARLAVITDHQAHYEVRVFHMKAISLILLSRFRRYKAVIHCR